MVPVRKITGISAQLPVFSFSRASNPSISGISISSNIKSGLIFPKRANIFAADGTVITLKWSSKASSAVARFVSLSSTTKIVFNGYFYPPFMADYLQDWFLSRGGLEYWCLFFNSNKFFIINNYFFICNCTNCLKFSSIYS